MAEKAADFCLLLALLVDDEEEKTRGSTQTASLNLFLISRSLKQRPKLKMLYENVGQHDGTDCARL